MIKKPKLMIGETIRTGASPVCCEVSGKLKYQVLSSKFGYYIGTYCPEHGPYTRESKYYRTKEQAQEALDTNKVHYRS